MTLLRRRGRVALAGLLAAALLGAAAAWVARQQATGFPLADAERASVEDLVDRAVAFATAEGREAALAEFSRPDGAFRDGSLYVFAYDFAGNVLAHGGEPGLVGRNLIDQVDANGLPVVRELIDRAREGSGWLAYRWPNPAHGNALEQKAGFVRRVDDGWFVGSGAYEAPTTLPTVRLQLKWYHQAQFAGVYMAQREGLFERRGLRVNAIPQDTLLNPIQSLVDGRADVAIASMAQAAGASVDGRRFVNIAQLFQRADSVLVCLFGPGRVSPSDLRGATIASSPDREPVVRELVSTILPGGGGVTYVRQQPDLGSLVSGEADCIWGSTFNEVPLAALLGLEVFLVRPEDYGVLNIEDGLYVDEARLADPAFRRTLTGLLLGLEDGWAAVRADPGTAEQVVLAQPQVRAATAGENGGPATVTAQRVDQRLQLQGVLALLAGPAFGYFDIAAFEKADAVGAPRLPEALAGRLWTHEIWGAARAARGDPGLLSPVTKHYLTILRASPAYQLMMTIGVFAAATAGALLAVRLRYRIWGMFVVGALTALGGGVVRDVILGGARYPIWLMRDQWDLVVVSAAVLTVWALANLASSGTHLADRFATWADVIGFAIIGVNGAMVALISDATPLLVPILAATSVAGGGILSDVLVNREHAGFTGEIYEEGAVVAGVVLIGLLLVANANEHHPGLILGTFLLTLAAMLGTRWAIVRHDIRYPPLGTLPWRRRRRAAPAREAAEPAPAA